MLMLDGIVVGTKKSLLAALGIYLAVNQEKAEPKVTSFNNQEFLPSFLSSQFLSLWIVDKGAREDAARIREWSFIVTFFVLGETVWA